MIKIDADVPDKVRNAKGFAVVFPPDSFYFPPCGWRALRTILITNETLAEVYGFCMENVGLVTCRRCAELGLADSSIYMEHFSLLQQHQLFVYFYFSPNPSESVVVRSSSLSNRGILTSNGNNGDQIA